MKQEGKGQKMSCRGIRRQERNARSAEHVLHELLLVNLHEAVVTCHGSRICRVRRNRETDFDANSVGLRDRIGGLVESVRHQTHECSFRKQNQYDMTDLLGCGGRRRLVHPIDVR